MASNLATQELSEEIQALKNKEVKQKKEIERLRNDNSTKMEQLARNEVPFFI